MNELMTEQRLRRENEVFRDSGGVSAGNRSAGFRPAFRDTRTNTVYLSRFRDGRPAPFHLLDGLPDEIVVARSESGGVAAVRPVLESGFVREGRFYTRDEAASAPMTMN